MRSSRAILMAAKGDNAGMVSPETSRSHETEAQAGAIVVVSGKPQVLPDPLNERDQRLLKHCEALLQKGLSTFFEVGNALLTIRENRLYRTSYPSFEAYCRHRWSIGRSYAWRVIGAAERLKLLPPRGGTPRPANEFQMRPFLKLEPGAFPKVWKEVTKRAKDGKVTSTLIQAVIDEVAPTGARPKSVRQLKHFDRGLRTHGLLGHLTALLHDAKVKTEQGKLEEVLAVLEQIETLLFSS